MGAEQGVARLDQDWKEIPTGRVRTQSHVFTFKADRCLCTLGAHKRCHHLITLWVVLVPDSGVKGLLSSIHHT